MAMARQTTDRSCVDGIERNLASRFGEYSPRSLTASTDNIGCVRSAYASLANNRSLKSSKPSNAQTTTATKTRKATARTIERLEEARFTSGAAVIATAAW